MKLSLNGQEYVVRVKHQRLYPFGNGLAGPMTSHQAKMADIPTSSAYPHGGKTDAAIFLNGDCIATGSAVCSKRDTYNKRIGRNIAVGRALRQLQS